MMIQKDTTQCTRSVQYGNLWLAINYTVKLRITDIETVKLRFTFHGVVILYHMIAMI